MLRFLILLFFVIFGSDKVSVFVDFLSVSWCDSLQKHIFYLLFQFLPEIISIILFGGGESEIRRSSLYYCAIKQERNRNQSNGKAFVLHTSPFMVTSIYPAYKTFVTVVFLCN